MGGRLIRGSATSRQTIPTPSSRSPGIPLRSLVMAQFINIIHPDLVGQMGRVPRASFPAWAESGWRIASDEDAGPNPRSRYVELARQEMQEEIEELALEAARTAADAARDAEKMAVLLAETPADDPGELVAEEPEPEPKPKTTTKPKTGSKT